MKTVASSMKWLLAAGVGVAGLALLALSSDGHDGADALPAATGAEPYVPPLPAESAHAREEGERTAARPARPSSAACGLDVGRRFGAVYQAVSTLELDEGTGVVGERSKAQTVSGRLAFEVLEASDAVAVVLVSFTAEQARAAGSSKEELAAPFLARVNDRCEVEAYARHVDTSVQTARLQQSLLHELWFSVPPPNAGAQVTFKNAVGEAFGKVRSEADGVIVRTIDLYGDAWSPDMAGVRVHQSVLRVERGGAPWFSSMEGRQRISVPATGATGTSTLEVVAAPFEPEALATASRDVGDYVWEMLLKKMSRQLTAAPIAQAERIESMRDVTFEQALTRFGTLVETKALREEQHLIMAAYLDAHPEHIEEYGKALASGFPNDWKPQGYAALQATQHPEAKRALLNIYREERLHPMERVRSSLALSGRHDVGAPVAEELAGVARSRAPAIDKVSVADHALMHLGILAGLHVDDQEVAGIATTTIEGALSSAKTPQALKTACLAVANTGNIAFLPALREWSNHPDPDMREHVAIGMRRMPVEAVREWVTEWLSRERSFRVKREIFEVMQRQYHDADAKLDDALIAQTVAHLDQRPRALTRQSIYRLLTPVVRTHADVRRALRESLVMELKKESGLAHYVMSILPQRDVDAALASIDSLRDQYASTNPVPDPVEDSPSEPEEDPPPPADMLEGTDNMALPSEPTTGVGVAP